MKRHITTKHNTKTPKKSKDFNTYDSLKLFHSSQEVRDQIDSNIYKDVTESFTDLNQTSSSSQFKCKLCKYERESEAALHGHISVTHDKTIPHTSKWDQKKVSYNAFTQTNNFKHHMIKQHGFENYSDKCMICEGTAVGAYCPMPFQAVFMNCKEYELIESEW